jgi:hypothetical protein
MSRSRPQLIDIDPGLDATMRTKGSPSTLNPSRASPVMVSLPSPTTCTAVNMRRSAPPTASFTSSATANVRAYSKRMIFHW